MVIRFHPHARERMAQRGANEKEVINTVTKGEKFEAKFGRIGYRRNFIFENKWRNKYYKNKQIEVYTVQEGKDYLVITVIVRYF